MHSTLWMQGQTSYGMLKASYIIAFDSIVESVVQAAPARGWHDTLFHMLPVLCEKTQDI